MSCGGPEHCPHCKANLEPKTFSTCSDSCGEYKIAPDNYGITDEDFDAACAKAEKAIQERAKETSYSSATPIADFYEPLTFNWDPKSARIARLAKEYLEGPTEGSKD